MNLASARKSGPSGIKNLRAGRLKQRKKLTTRPCCPEAHVGILPRAGQREGAVSAVQGSGNVWGVDGVGEGRDGVKLQFD